MYKINTVFRSWDISFTNNPQNFKEVEMNGQKFDSINDLVDHFMSHPLPDYDKPLGELCPSLDEKIDLKEKLGE